MRIELPFYSARWFRVYNYKVSSWPIGVLFLCLTLNSDERICILQLILLHNLSLLFRIIYWVSFKKFLLVILDILLYKFDWECKYMKSWQKPLRKLGIKWKKRWLQVQIIQDNRFFWTSFLFIKVCYLFIFSSHLLI